MGSHAFNLSTGEVETKVLWLGRERNIGLEETGAHYSQRMQSEERVALLF